MDVSGPFLYSVKLEYYQNVLIRSAVTVFAIPLTVIGGLLLLLLLNKFCACAFVTIGSLEILPFRANSIKLYRSVNYGFVVTAKF